MVKASYLFICLKEAGRYAQECLIWFQVLYKLSSEAIKMKIANRWSWLRFQFKNVQDICFIIIIIIIIIIDTKNRTKTRGQDGHVLQALLPDKFGVKWLFGSREEIQFRISR